jgi:hypothetical protein
MHSLHGPAFAAFGQLRHHLGTVAVSQLGVDHGFHREAKNDPRVAIGVLTLRWLLEDVVTSIGMDAGRTG